MASNIPKKIELNFNVAFDEHFNLVKNILLDAEFDESAFVCQHERFIIIEIDLLTVAQARRLRDWLNTALPFPDGPAR